MSAVPALPDLALFKDFLGLHIPQQGPVALLVALFNGGHQAEFGGQLWDL